MSLMQAQRQKDLKYLNSTLLKSSKDLGWSLIAELRSHSRYEGTGAAAPPDAEVGIIVRGSDEGLTACKVDGSWQHARLTTGSIWLRPVGGKSEGPHRLGDGGRLTLIRAHRCLCASD
jgi:AraC family transcriptional regulator